MNQEGTKPVTIVKKKHKKSGELLCSTDSSLRKVLQWAALYINRMKALGAE